MNDIAIRVDSLGKQYRLGGKPERYKTLRDTLVGVVAAPFRAIRSGSPRANGESTIWALKDVSFEVKQGEVVGVIGRNGAGKSTLLKILSQITEPTEGYAEIHGRVGSLLEVGTGFHPELSGRENIYLNGAILGMGRSEIDRKFDEIVAFAEVEKFIDTPVKHYSSGMYLRLAFAVAAHMEPEILIVDEVLAVGDAAFQNKCLGKMGEVAKEGRTVFFVSHNLQAIQRLCTKAYLLNNGTLLESGTPNTVINSYLGLSIDKNKTELEAEVVGSEIHFKRVTLTQNGDDNKEFLDNNMPFEVQIEYNLLTDIENLLLGFDVFSDDGTLVFRTYDMQTVGLGYRMSGSYHSICRLPGNVFQTGHYYLYVVAGIHRVKWLCKDKISVRLHFDGSRDSDVSFPGIILPVGNWKVNKDGDGTDWTAD